MISFDDVAGENRKIHNPNCSQILDHLYRILIIGGPGSGNTNALRILLGHQQDIDKIYSYSQDQYEAKH